MGQVNVNTPSDGGSGEPAGSTGAGMILGIIVAVILIAALIYFLLLASPPDNGGTDVPADVNGDTNGDVEPPSSWRLVDLA